MHEEHMSEEYEAAIEELLGIIGNVPRESVTMLNMPRYMQAIVSINKIVKFIKADCPDAELAVEFDGITGTRLCLRIIADELNIYKIGEFCKAIEPASTMDVI